MRGNNPTLTLKQHFPSYLIDINSDFFQTFITGFRLSHEMKLCYEGLKEIEVVVDEI